jgi:hypothetical protein
VQLISSKKRSSKELNAFTQEVAGLAIEMAKKEKREKVSSDNLK